MGSVKWQRYHWQRKPWGTSVSLKKNMGSPTVCLLSVSSVCVIDLSMAFSIWSFLFAVDGCLECPLTFFFAMMFDVKDFDYADDAKKRWTKAHRTN